MKIELKHLYKKIVFGLVNIAVFVYIITFIASIPSDFTIKKSQNEITLTHPVGAIVNRTNERFLSILKLDLRQSINMDKSLAHIFKKMSVNSFKLVIYSVIFSFFLGLVKGIFDSRKGKGENSSLKVLMTIVPISLPDILIIALIQKLAIFLIQNDINVIRVAVMGDISFREMLSPIITLSILPACYIARITAISIEDCYRKEYIKTALGKGCSRFRILWNHVMRNAIINIIENIPAITSIVIGNMLIVEYIFAYPGLTRSLMNFFEKGDTNGIIACVMMIGFIYFVLDFIFKSLRVLFTKRLREG